MGDSSKWLELVRNSSKSTYKSFVLLGPGIVLHSFFHGRCQLSREVLLTMHIVDELDKGHIYICCGRKTRQIMKASFWEDDLWGKMTFGERWLSVEDDLWWKTTFGGRPPMVEDDLLWKTTFGGRQPSVEDDLWWKTTFSGRLPLVDPCRLLIHFAEYF